MPRARRTQLLIAAIALAGALAAVLPALVLRARVAGARPADATGAPGTWPGIADGAGQPPAGRTVLLLRDLSLADALAGAPLVRSADAVAGVRGGAVAALARVGGRLVPVAAASDPGGPRAVLSVPAGGATAAVALFDATGGAIDATALAAAVQAFKAARPDGVAVAFVSWSAADGSRTARRAGTARTLRRAGADLILGSDPSAGPEASTSDRRWIFYGLDLGGGATLALRLVLRADDGGRPIAELRAYPIVRAGGAAPRPATAAEYADAYWGIVTGSWGMEDRMLKRRLGLGFDDGGRHFALGRLAAAGAR